MEPQVKWVQETGQGGAGGHPEACRPLSAVAFARCNQKLLESFEQTVRQDQYWVESRLGGRGGQGVQG